MKRVFIVSFLACLAIMGCSKQTDNNNDLAYEQTAISVNSTIDGVATNKDAAGRAATDELPTASKKAWDDQDKFGFFLSLSSDALKFVGNTHGRFSYDNIPYTYSAATTNFSPNPTLYYPYRTTNVDFWGVFPFDNDITTKNVAQYAWSVKTDQSSDANVLASDLLVAHKANIVPNGTAADINKTVDLPFFHKMTRLMLTVTIPQQIDGRQLSTTKPIETIEVRGVKTNGTYDFNLNTVTATGSKQVVSPRSCGYQDTPEVQYFYEALLVPQTVAVNELFLRVIVNYEAPHADEPGLYMLNLAAPLVLAIGTQKNMSVVFDGQMRLRLDGSQVAKWNDAPIKSDNIYTDQSTVRISNVDWATGNLVFDGKFGCKIGQPTDKGLFFQFGSLVGWDEGATLSAKAYPSGITPAWNSNYYNAATTTGEIFNLLAQDNATATPGQGDACRYYLGNGWRLPTAIELASISGKSGASAIAWAGNGVTGQYNTSPAGAWFGSLFANKNILTSLYTPASGQRAAAAGALSEANASGYYSSSTVTAAATASRLKFDASGVTPALPLDRKVGASIRCVKPFSVFTYDPTPMAKAAASSTKLTFDFTSDASWEITGAPAWLTISSISGTKTAATPAMVVTLTATENTTAAIRTAQLTIKGTEKARGTIVTKIVTVSQKF